MRVYNYVYYANIYIYLCTIIKIKTFSEIIARLKKESMYRLMQQNNNNFIN